MDARHRMSLWTTWGGVRGCCGHVHLRHETALHCLRRDQTDCRVHGGYSDRQIREISSREELRTYDVTRGPGR